MGFCAGAVSIRRNGLVVDVVHYRTRQLHVHFFVCPSVQADMHERPSMELTEWPKAGIWESGKRDLEPSTSAVAVAGTDHAASNIGVLALGERCDI